MKTRYTPTRLLAQLTISFLVLAALNLTAAQRIWTGLGANTNWSTIANWDTGVPANGDDIVFNGATPLGNTNNIPGLSLNGITYNAGGQLSIGLFLTNSLGVVDNAGNNTNNINFNLGGAQGFTNNSPGTALVFGGSVTNNGFALSIGGDGNVFLNGVVNGAGGLSLDGNGTLRLAGANLFSGAVTLNAGQLQIANAAAIPSGNGRGDVTVNSGATLNLNGNSQAINGLSGAGTVDNLTGTATYTLTVGNNATNASSGIFTGAIQNTTGLIGLTKVNTNIFTINGSANHTGPTIINGGTLALGSSTTMPATPIITVNPGARFDVSALAGGFSVSAGQGLTAGVTTNGGPADVVGPVSLAGGTITVYRPAIAGTMTFSQGLSLSSGTLNYDLANTTTPGAGINDLIAINGQLDLLGGAIFQLNPSAGSITPGTYTLITNSTALVSGSAASLVASAPRGITVAFDSTTAPGSLLANISGSSSPGTIRWQAGSGAAWDVTTSQNWLNGASADYFYNLDNVVFDDFPGAGTVVQAVAVSPGSTTFSNSTIAYVMGGGGAGVISGGGSLTMNGPGSVTLNAPNNYAGPTIVNRGALIMGNYLTGTFVNNIPVYNGVAPNNLTLGAGGMFVNGSANTFNSATFSNLLVKPGGSSIAMRNRQANNTTYFFQFNNLLREVGGTLDMANIQTRAGSRVGLYSTNVTTLNGILGGWVTIYENDWVVPSNAALGAVPYAAYTTSADPTTWLATNNLNLSASPLSALNDIVVNSLKLTTASTITINNGQTLRLTSGGVLKPSNATGASTITGGTLMGSTNGDLVVHAMHAANSVTVASSIADNTGSSALTKAGQGTLILSGNNSYSGPTYINGSTLGGGGGTAPTTIPAGTLQIGSGGTTGNLGNSPVVTNYGNLAFNRSDALTLAIPVHGPGTLTKQGAGTLTLTGGNTYSGATTISAGTLQVGNGGTVGSLGNTPSIANNATLVFNRSDSVGFNGPISGLGSLTKQGAAQLTLNGTNTYAGVTAISGGTLVLGATGSISNSSAIVVSSGTTLNASAAGGLVLNGGSVNQILAGSGSVIGNVTTLPGTRITPATNGVTDTLALNNALNLNGGTINFDISSTVKDLITVAGNLDLSAGSIQLNVTGTLPNGTYTLIQYSGTLSGSVGNISVGGFSQLGQVATLSSATPGQINLVVITYNGQNLVWQGDGGNNFWDVTTSLNWTNPAGVSVVFSNLDNVTFNDTSANLLVNLQGLLNPVQATVNSVNNYTFQGSGQIGTGFWTKNNTGTLTILSTNGLTGPTTVNGGLLQLGDGIAAGVLGTGNVTNNASIVFNEPGDQIIANSIAGNGSVTQQGAGEVILTGNSTLTGPLNINTGTVRVGAGGASGALGNGPVTNNTSLTFDRSGTLAFSGGIHGSGALGFVGVGTVTLGGVNDYLGATSISNGTVKLAASAIIPDGSGFANVILDGSATVAGTLDLNGFNETLNALDGAGVGGNVLGKVVNNAGTATNILTLGSGDASGNFSGQIFDNTGSGGKIQLRKVGAGTQILNVIAALGNPYSAGTIISNGVLQLATPYLGGGVLQVPNANNVGLGTGPVTIYGGTLQTAGYTGNNTPTYAMGVPIIVPTNASATILVDARGLFSSAITGAGDVLLGVNYVRCDIAPNLTGFFGGIVASNGPAGGDMRIPAAGVNSFANTRLHLVGTVTMYSVGTANSVISFGELTGEATTTIGGGSGGNVAGIWRVGLLNGNTNFPGNITDGTGGIIKDGTGTWALTGVNSYGGVTAVTNSGTLILGTDTAFSVNTSAFELRSPGSKLDVSLLSGSSLNLSVGQALRGVGTVLGSVNAAGPVAPGLPIGTLTVTNVANLSGTVTMEINRTNSQTSDRLNAASILASGATLTVTNAGPANLAPGDTFTLFSPPITGAFAAVNLPPLPCAGLQWTNKLDVDGTIQVVGSPCQQPITVTPGSGTVGLSWPDLGMQLQTNAASVVEASAWYPYPGSTTVTNITINIQLNKTNVFFRLVYP